MERALPFKQVMDELVKNIMLKRSCYLQDVLSVVRDEIEGKSPLTWRKKEIAKALGTERASDERLTDCLEKVKEELQLRETDPTRSEIGRRLKSFIEETFVLDPDAEPLTAKDIKNLWRDYKRIIAWKGTVKEHEVLSFIQSLDGRSSQTKYYGLKVIDFPDTLV